MKYCAPPPKSAYAHLISIIKCLHTRLVIFIFVSRLISQLCHPWVLVIVLSPPETLHALLAYVNYIYSNFLSTIVFYGGNLPCVQLGLRIPFFAQFYTFLLTFLDLWHVISTIYRIIVLFPFLFQGAKYCWISIEYRLLWAVSSHNNEWGAHVVFQCLWPKYTWSSCKTAFLCFVDRLSSW